MPRYEVVTYSKKRHELTLDALAVRAGLHPALVRRYIEFGLIEPVEREGAMPLFDDAAVPRLRRINRLRQGLGINLAGVSVVLDLLDRMSALKRENAALRVRL